MDEIDLHERITRLRIFEPRYAAMTRDALAGDRLIAMATLKPGFEADYFGAPAIYSTVCVGAISASGETGEGLYQISVRGVARARVAEEETVGDGYRLGRLTLIVERIEPVDRELTYRIACNVAELLRRTAIKPSLVPEKPDDEERSIISFSYEVINALSLGPGKRLELRDAASPRERLHKEAVILSQLDKLLRNGSRGKSSFHGFSLS